MSFASLLDFAARCGGSFFALFTMSPGKSPSPVLIIEPFTYHEQVFLPMVEVFSSLGQAVDLVTVPGALVCEVSAVYPGSPPPERMSL